MTEERRTADTTEDDGGKIELRGTDPRVFLPSLTPPGTPGGRQPILPEDREAAKNAVKNHS